MHRRQFFGLVLALVALGSPVVRGDDYAELKPLIEKGIESAGGREKLSKLKGLTLKFTGNYHGMGGAAPFTGRMAKQGSDRMRVEIDNVYTIVFRGDAGWMSINGMTIDFNKDQLEGTKEEMHIDDVSSLLPLGSDKYRVSKTGETKVDGKDAVGLRVEREGHRSVDLWLEKSTGLVLKRAAQVNSQEKAGALVAEETVFSEFKTIDGMQSATKTVARRDGELYLEMDASDLKLVELVDDSEFQKP